MTRPVINADDYVLTQVHDTETKAFTRLKNGDAWRNHLSLEDYVMREHVLSLSKMASSDSHQLMVFIMTKKDDPDVPLCSCELLVRKGYRYLPTAAGVERRDVMSGCVGAVFTYLEHRGKGYALIMIDHLVSIAKSPEVLGEDGFIFLYSEVGEYYARNGFKSFGVPLAKFPLTATGESYVGSDNVKLLKFHEFADVFKAYVAQSDQNLKQKVAQDGIERITAACNEEYVDWFHLRSKYLGLKLFDEALADWDFSTETIDSLAHKFADTNPKYFGLELTCSQSGASKGFIVWTYDFEYSKEENQFHNYVTVIKKFVSLGFDEFETTLELFEQMKQFLEAKHPEPQMSNFQEVKLWESEVLPSVVQVLKTNYKAKAGIENSSRSALMMTRELDNRRMREGKIIWEENTKLPWF